LRPWFFTLEFVFFIFVELFHRHARRSRELECQYGVENRGSGGEYNNQPLSGIDSVGTAVRGDGGSGGCSVGAMRRQQWQRRRC
jgi:hypothetical protein